MTDTMRNRRTLRHMSTPSKQLILFLYVCVYIYGEATYQKQDEGVFCFLEGN